MVRHRTFVIGLTVGAKCSYRDLKRRPLVRWQDLSGLMTLDECSED